MKQKLIYRFIPQYISNEGVIFFFSLLRFLQKMKPYKSEIHLEKNKSEFQKHKESIEKYDGYIEDQNQYQNMDYGRVTMAYAGCEIIAAYNALWTLTGEKIELSELISTFEKDGMVFGGRFGTAPGAIKSYFEKKGYKVYFTTKEKRFEEITEKSDVLILTMYNNKSDIRDQIHTVTITKQKQGLCGHNVYGNGKIAGPNDCFLEFMEQICQGKSKGISLIGIKKD